MWESLLPSTGVQIKHLLARAGNQTQEKQPGEAFGHQPRIWCEILTYLSCWSAKQHRFLHFFVFLLCLKAEFPCVKRVMPASTGMYQHCTGLCAAPMHQHWLEMKLLRRQRGKGALLAPA